MAVLSLVAILASLAVVIPRALAQAADLRINEFVASNATGLVDNAGERSDWIELHNTSGVQINLNGWTISDGATSHTFGLQLVPAGGFIVVFASGDVTRSVPGEPHLPFKLDAAGEPLTLVDPSGAVSNPAWPAPGYPQQFPDDAYGVDAAGQLAYFETPTPGGVNGAGAPGRAAPVEFSLAHGFYDVAQTVTLSSATPGAAIRYTLDGSTPTETNGALLANGSSITVGSTSNVRAVAFLAGWITSTVETRSYLFAADIVAQSEAPPPGWPADNTINGMRAFYGIDSDLDPASLAAVEDALTAIPSMSLTTDLPNLFDPATGIWTNPYERGAAWERPVSIELIDPTGAETGFEINGGLRLRGNSSRDPRNFKHSMRLVFDDEYGDGELNYALFGSEGVDQFEAVDLKTAQSWSWNAFSAPNAGRGTEATWLRDIWNRDTQGAMGQPYARSRYVHAFINGQYWGLYMTEERVTNQHAAQYTGGDEQDFDVVKRNSGQGFFDNIHVEARDGTIDDWVSLWALVEDHQLSDAEWAIFRDEVDLENLADYYLLMFVGGDSDGTPRYTKTYSNNWLAFRNRAGVGEAAKWQFNDRDSESALCTNVGSGRPPDWDPTFPWNLDAGLGSYLPAENFLAPAWLFEAAMTQPEFVQIFKDRIHLHMLTPGGVLTVPESIARLDARAAVVDLVIDAESARWGDTWVADAFDRTDWEQATATVRNCFQLRTDVIETYLVADGLWPDGDAPEIDPVGGAVAFGTSVSVTADGGGTLWATVDGSDPRAPDGTVSPTAFVVAGPISVTGDLTITARTLLPGGVWSPVATEDFVLSTPDGPPRLIVNEFNAVSSTRFLGDGGAGDIANGSDATFGRVAGNGGDWFELVVVEDHLDIRGWTFEIWNDAGAGLVRDATITLGNDVLLSDLRAGSILTVSEDIADDVSYFPPAGDWHINLQSNSAGDGAYVAVQSSFAINNDDTQIAVFDAAGSPEALRTGEGTAPNATVSSVEVFKLQRTPSSATQPGDPDYDDGTTSTWGLANQWDSGNEEQDLSGLRIDFGNPNCDTRVSIADAMFIAQFVVGIRVDSGCPIVDPLRDIDAAAGDTDLDGDADVLDALRIAQCEIGIINTFCPN